MNGIIHACPILLKFTLFIERLTTMILFAKTL